jgi:hypothetical protein
MITDIASKRSIWGRLSKLREAPSRSYGLPGRAATHYVGACRRLCKPTAAFDGKFGNFVIDPGFFTRLVYEGV